MSSSTATDMKETGHAPVLDTAPTHQPISNSQRLKRPPISWPVWVCRNTVFLFIKFLVVFAFYSMHLHHDRVHTVHHDDHHASSLRKGLAEFRRTSRRASRAAETTWLKNNETLDESVASNFYWSKLEVPSPTGSIVDPFPESFDAVFYRAQTNEDYHHYTTFGREHGLQGSRGQKLREILATEIVPLLPSPVMEVGPFINPLLRGNTIEYFDVANWAGLVRKAKELDYIVSPDPVEITHVHTEGDLTSVNRPDTYSLLLSSHVLTMQTDIVRHLQSVSRLLTPNGGYYVAFVQDKRYGANHFAEESTIAEVLDDFYSDRRTPKLRSLIESMVFQTSEDTASDIVLQRQWRGDNGKSPFTDSGDPKFLQRLHKALESYRTSSAASSSGAVNMDVPQYHFTPHTLAIVVDTLYTMQLTDLRVHQLYDTLAGSGEFSLVLQRCPHPSAP